MFQTGVTRTASNLVQFVNGHVDLRVASIDSKIHIAPRPQPLTYRKVCVDITPSPRSANPNDSNSRVVFVRDTLNLRTLTMCQASPLCGLGNRLLLISVIETTLYCKFRTSILIDSHEKARIANAHPPEPFLYPLKVKPAV